MSNETDAPNPVGTPVVAVDGQGFILGLLTLLLVATVIGLVQKTPKTFSSGNALEVAQLQAHTAEVQRIETMQKLAAEGCLKAGTIPQFNSGNVTCVAIPK